MLVDSWYDSYLGVVVLVRVIDGQLKKNQKILFMAAKATHTIDRVGIFSPKPIEVESLGPGEIGFINSGIKSVADCKVGDTITEEKNLHHRFQTFSTSCFLWNVSSRNR